MPKLCARRIIVSICHDHCENIGCTDEEEYESRFCKMDLADLNPDGRLCPGVNCPMHLNYPEREFKQEKNV